MFTLSPDQKKVLDHIIEWYKHDRNDMQYVALGGYAGTGKTTLIAVLRRELSKLEDGLKVGFASYTGKAARVLHSKLHTLKVIFPKDSVGTIHSLIYSPEVNEKEEIIGWIRKNKIDRNLIIIDEASMVDETIWRHLTAYKVPIIVVGDHGQLPPISGRFNLMDKPELKLEQIHRQAEGNPIIRLSKMVRETGTIPVQHFSDTVRKFDKNESGYGESMMELLSSYNPETLVLCGYNTTRKRLNTHIRTALGFENPEPREGDRVICLRNNHKKRVFNGMLGTIRFIEPEDNDWYFAEIEMDGEDKLFKGKISAKQFNADTAMNYTKNRSEIMKGDLFDFGYALTVHKAQGSQAKRVILFEERFKQMSDEEWRRWLYTAVTRAAEELYIFA